MTVRLGLDRLAGADGRRLDGKRVALLAHPASVTADLTHALDALAGRDEVDYALVRLVTRQRIGARIGENERPDVLGGEQVEAAALAPTHGPGDHPEALGIAFKREKILNQWQQPGLVWSEALLQEHGARIVATQSAEQWLDERIERLRRHLAAARRESSTQEMIEIGIGMRARARRLEAE